MWKTILKITIVVLAAAVEVIAEVERRKRSA